jgi:ABC-2 type transport system permease protein
MSKSNFIWYTKLILIFSRIHLAELLEYRLEKILTTFAIFIREITSVAVVFLLLTRFIEIRGWNLNELLFLYSFLFLSYSVFLLFFTGLRDFDLIIYSGEFDWYLLRPIGLVFQIIVARMDLMALLGHGTIGIILFVTTSNLVSINWNLPNILFFIIALFSGALIQASIFFIASTLSFWAVKITNIRNLLFFNTRKFAGYPISFYPTIIQKFLIFVIPFAFVNYFPAQFFLKKPDMNQYWSGFLYLAPAVSIIVCAIAYLFWKMGLKRYSSTGNSMF